MAANRRRLTLFRRSVVASEAFGQESPFANKQQIPRRSVGRHSIALSTSHRFVSIESMVPTLDTPLFSEYRSAP